MRPTVAVLCLAGCAQRAYSPPARGFSLESPKTLGADESALGVGGGVAGVAFGPTLAVGEVSLRHGVSPDVDLVGDATWLSVTDASGAGVDRNIYAGRGGLKLRPEGMPFAVLVGGGLGYAPAGGAYVAGDAGFVVGWENCVLVPFAQTGLMASVPLDPHAVDLTRPEDKMQVLDTPTVTYGWSVGLGLRLVLQHARCEAGQPAASLVSVGGGTQLWDGRKSDGFAMLGFGVELPL
jgi:hypothetical protein